jgi:hypothetical protein
VTLKEQVGSPDGDTVLAADAHRNLARELPPEYILRCSAPGAGSDQSGAGSGSHGEHIAPGEYMLSLSMCFSTPFTKRNKGERKAGASLSREHVVDLLQLQRLGALYTL